MAKEKTVLEHSANKNSTLVWFVLSLIPIVNLYVLWKIAKIVAHHEEKA